VRWRGLPRHFPPTSVRWRRQSDTLDHDGMQRIKLLQGLYVLLTQRIVLTLQQGILLEQR
jgi:hypothetical protein